MVRRATRPLALAAAAALVALARDVAASPSAKLVYVRGVGADTCPDEQHLRKAVATRIGYDPFFPTAQKTVIAQVTRTAQGYRGKVQIVGDDGKVRGERDLSSQGDDCAEIVNTMALAVSIALDDLDEQPPSPPGPASPAEPPPEVAAPPAGSTEPAAPPPPRASDAPEGSHVTLDASLGPVVSLGTAPSAAFGGSVAGTLGVGGFGARLDLRGELPASGSFAPGGTVSTSTVVGSLSGCARAKVPFGCLGVGLGSIASTTEGISRPASDHGRLVEVVAIAGAKLALGSTLYFEPYVSGAIQLTPQRIEVDGARVFSLPIASGALGAHLGVHFL